MKHIIDPELIMLASPDYKYGRRLGLTDEETERSTLETMDAMKKAYDKTLPRKLKVLKTNTYPAYACECGSIYMEWCGGGDMDYCTGCGQAIDWSTDEN